MEAVEGGLAVLAVATDRGDLILDNPSPEIRSWHETPYRFVKRQSAPPIRSAGVLVISTRCATSSPSTVDRRGVAMR